MRKDEFHDLLSYSRFMQLMPGLMQPLTLLLHLLSGKRTGKYFIDATTISVYHNKRSRHNKVLKDLAASSKGLFFWI
jgi:hypothetical protein